MGINPSAMIYNFWKAFFEKWGQRGVYISNGVFKKVHEYDGQVQTFGHMVYTCRKERLKHVFFVCLFA